jgi:hypothetical protein
MMLRVYGVSVLRDVPVTIYETLFGPTSPFLGMLRLDA